MQNQVRRLIAWPLCVLLLYALLIQTATAAPPPKPNQAYFPKTSDTQYQKGGTLIDYGYSYDGYIMVKYTKPGDKRIKCRVTKDDGVYNYDIPRDGEFVVLPLQMGSGQYKIAMFEQIRDNSYSAAASLTIPVELTSKYIPYLYPNQYVNYNEYNRAVEKSRELCDGLQTEQEKFDAIWKFCTQEISYHRIRAEEVSAGMASGYLPDVDQTLREGMGICFDYASLMACMLRVQSIPTRLDIGYADKTYHAWNEVLLGSEWVRKDPTYQSTGGIASTYTVNRRY